MWVWFIIAGVIAGIVGGMGMGGGTLLIPILTLLFGIGQHLAQGLNLLVFIPTAVIAIIIHAKHKLLDYKTFLIIIVPAIMSSILFSILSNSVDDKILKIIFGVFLACLGLIMLILGVVKHIKAQKRLTKKLGIE